MTSTVLCVEETPVGKVRISHRLYQEMQRYRQTGMRNETGGALAGYRKEQVWVISRLMPPSPKNKSGRTWLERDLKAAQAFANKVHKESGGYFTYVGEWHTHPVEIPNLSDRDKEMFEDILKGSKRPLNFLFGLILGTKGSLCFWYQDQKGNVLTHHPKLPKGYEPQASPTKETWWPIRKRVSK